MKEIEMKGSGCERYTYDDSEAKNEINNIHE